jgi:hypothetical protein
MSRIGAITGKTGGAAGIKDICLIHFKVKIPVTVSTFNGNGAKQPKRIGSIVIGTHASYMTINIEDVIFIENILCIPSPVVGAISIFIGTIDKCSLV